MYITPQYYVKLKEFVKLKEYVKLKAVYAAHIYCLPEVSRYSARNLYNTTFIHKVQ
jgi:hypothetical protein